MAPHCKIINFSSCSLSWLLEMILGSEMTNPKTPITSYLWHVSTKYYTSEVLVNIHEHEEVIDNKVDFSTTEAVVFYCDTTKDTLNKVEDAWQKIKESSPAVCLYVVESATDDVQKGETVSRTQILDWCLSNQFELVECNEDEEDVDSDEVERFDEKSGRERIIQALKAHTWSNLELIEESEKKENTGEECEEEDSLKNPLLVAAEEALGEDPSFEDLFAQISKMKDISNNLPDAERKAYAEKVALAFYKSIGGDSEEEEE